MAYTVEQACPQCAGPIEFSETDHLILCGFCNVKSFLAANEYHFVMPADLQDEHVLAPYLRFRGVEYVSDNKGVGHRIVDFTQLGLPFKALPSSLGVRPQAVKLRFVGNEKGRFLKNYLTLEKALSRVETVMKDIRQQDISHRVYVGESVSRIYLPLSIRNNKLFDGVSDQMIGNLPEGRDIFEPAYDDGESWTPQFIATICPQCGWNLDGETDSIALSCGNCSTLWKIEDGRFVKLDFEVFPGGDDCLFIPFWKIEPEFKGIELNSYGGFLKVTNQPMVIKPEWWKRKLYFWTPAFKVRPKIYLRLTKQLTVSQKEFEPQENLPKRLNPVTLPISEAVESLKIVLASAATHKKKILPILPDISCSMVDYSLVFIPFSIGHHDLIQENLRININKKVLEYGRYL